jgi:hypothetical protein
MRQSLSRRIGCAWLAALLIGGCGGGGGSGSGTSSSGSNAVAVGPPTPAKITATKTVGDSLGIVKLTGKLTGDADSLQGKAVTVVVEDPAQLFSSAGALTVARATSGLTYELTLAGRPLSASGHFTGNLRILACLDAACQQPLSGTPLSVPYDLTVEDGVTLSRQEINITVPFGTVPAVENVEVGWSSLTSGWTATTKTPVNPYSADFVSILNGTGTGKWLTDHQLQLQALPRQPGTYTATVSVRSVAVLPDNSRPVFEKEIAVRYTVTPNPDVDYLVWPAPPFEVTHSASNELLRFHSHSILPNTGGTIFFLGVDYLSGAGTQGPATRWWDEPYGGAYFTCSDTCLLPGLYTAQIRYRITLPNGTRDIAIPVRMTVTP